MELLGLEKLTNAFGLLLLFQGVAGIFGSPIAGMFLKTESVFENEVRYGACMILVNDHLQANGLHHFAV